MTVIAIARSFAVLRAVSDEPRSLSEIARHAGLPVSTSARILETLEQEGAVSRDESSRFAIGPAIVELATGAAPIYNLLPLVTSHLTALANQTGETAGIAEAIGDDLVHLGQVATDSDVTVRDWTGVQVPAHSGCTGIVLMAYWPPAQLDAYLSRDLERFTDATVVDPAAIRARIDRVRRRGWLWSTGEYAADVTSVAAPIRDASGRAVAALHCHGPAFRFPLDEDRDDIGASVRERAEQISAVLGHRPGTRS